MEPGNVDLAHDINSQNFSVIRLASYRTAVKIRFIQKRTHRNYLIRNLNIYNSRLNYFFICIVHFVDIWNLIEGNRRIIIDLLHRWNIHSKLNHFYFYVYSLSLS